MTQLLPSDQKSKWGKMGKTSSSYNSLVPLQHLSCNTKESFSHFPKLQPSPLRPDFLGRQNACSHVAPVPFRTLPLSWCAILALPQFCLSLGSPKGRRCRSSSQGKGSHARQALHPGGGWRNSSHGGAQGAPPTLSLPARAWCPARFLPLTFLWCLIPVKWDLTTWILLNGIYYNERPKGNAGWLIFLYRRNVSSRAHE